MAQDVITNAILIIAAIISVVILINAVYPALFAATGSITNAAGTAGDRVNSDLRVVMSSRVNSTAVQVWVKNIGSTRVPAGEISYTDVYFGDQGGSMARASVSSTSGFWWTYSLDETDGDGDWDQGETVQMTIFDGSGSRFTPGDHAIKLVLFNGAGFEDTITI
ncbi:MAG TPA: hypothetical protein VK436_13655 [Methanocella sp.]|nr:hypothetical protein [Methanocella sp.]